MSLAGARARRPEQLELRLRGGWLALPEQEREKRAVLARGFLCRFFKARMSREECARRQLRKRRVTSLAGAPKPEAARDAHCPSGRCRQGLGVLVKAGLARVRPCPACGGCGGLPELTQEQHPRR